MSDAEAEDDPHHVPAQGPLATILSHPKSVMTLMIAMLMAGVLAYITVPKEANPDIDVPIFYISVPQSGISPEDAERLLVRPLETKLRGLDGLKEITGIASEGHGAILLEFDISFDKDAALADVRDKIDQAKVELPDEADEPQIFEQNFSLVPTIVVALSGNVPERTLYQHARRLKDQIEGVSTVLEANLTGHREELLEVEIDSTRLESYSISQGQLIRAVTANNQLIAAGALDTGQGRFNVKVPGLFEDAIDVYSLPVKVEGDSVVTLSDVATIRRTFKDASGYSRYNGQLSITIEVKKRIGTNIIENNADVRKVVNEYTETWPDAIEINFILDESKFIFEVLGSLQSAILTASALVMIVVVAALGMRSALLVGIAIPTSFMIGFLIVGLLGMTVNMMVMFGLVLTVGMLVDGAIVIVEYADRKMAEGLKRREAYIMAAQRMFWPIVSSTATTLAAFLSLLMWPGVSGEFMSYLPLMVIIVLSAALLTAMIFLPVVGGLIGATNAGAAQAQSARMLSGGSRVDYKQIPGFTGFYVRFLKLLAGNPIGNMITIAAVIGLTIAVFDAFGRNAAGVEFFVDVEADQAVVFVSARGNLSAEEARDLAIEVEEIVLDIEGIEAVLFSTGASGGGQLIGGVEDKPVDTVGELSLEFEDYCCRRKAVEIFAEIREKTANMPGIKVEVRKIEGGPPTGKHIRLELTAPTYEAVREAAGLVRMHMETGMEHLRDVEDTRPLPGIEWEMTVDRQEAGRFGTDIQSVGGMIQLVTNGILVGKYRPDDSEDEIDIRVRLPESERSLDRLDQLRIQTPMGMVPIRNFVTREAKPLVSSITRQNGNFSMTVNANVVSGIDGVDPNTKIAELDEWLAAQTFEGGINYRFRGADEEQKEAQAFLGKGAAAALFIMFVILVTQFNSFYQTILTLSTVMLAVVGVLIGMLVTGQKFSVIMTGAGVVALAGIVVNNSIVLMDTYNRMRSEGLEPLDAVLRTAAQRLRPILLTTITTIMGLVPMATQINLDFFNRVVAVGGITSIWWVQLSTAVIFGLAFSTTLTLVLIPVMLTLPSTWMRFFKAVFLWFRRKLRRGAPEGMPEDAVSVAPGAGMRTATATERRKKPQKKRKLGRAPARPLPQAAE